MEQEPLVTAIITTCKRPVPVVKRALDSITEQTYENLEIILVNDAPEDLLLAEQLRTLCRQARRFVLYLEMEHNSGACRARNCGLAAAQGSLIAFLDDDDRWAKDKIKWQAACFHDERIGIVYGNTWIHSEKRKRVRLHYKGEMPQGMVFGALLGRNFIGSSSFPMIRRSCLEETGGFREDMPALQDWELWLRLALRYEVRYLAQPLGTYYFYAGDRISAHPERRTAGYERIEAQYETYLRERPNEQAAFDRMGVTFYVNHREFGRAWIHLKRAFRLEPGQWRQNGFILMKWMIRFFWKAKLV